MRRPIPKRCSATRRFQAIERPLTGSQQQDVLATDGSEVCGLGIVPGGLELDQVRQLTERQTDSKEEIALVGSIRMSYGNQSL